jgi:hypothetical protein
MQSERESKFMFGKNGVRKEMVRVALDEIQLLNLNKVCENSMLSEDGSSKNFRVDKAFGFLNVGEFEQRDGQ